jgi:excisionase family DNA binding protein
VRMASDDPRLRERAELLDELWTSRPAPGMLGGRLLRTREVALLFQVSERAVTDWAGKGRLPSVRTPGGHRRYPASAVRELLTDAGLLPV